MYLVHKNTPSSDGVGKPQESVLSEIDCVLQSKYTPKKQKSQILSVLYRDLGYVDKAQRVFDCGEYLEFAHPVFSDASFGSTHLYKANFCRDRFCPMCSWRKSLKLFGQVSSVMEHLQNDYKYLFLTLTVVNCSPEELHQTIDDMFHALDIFFKRREIKRIVKGYFRTLEITRNDKDGTFHPHFHLILAVPLTYAEKGKEYIHQRDWLRYWKESFGDNRINQVNIKVIKPDILSDKTTEIVFQKAIAEISKYSVKGSDFLFSYDLEKSKQILSFLLPALHGRRLFHFAGCFRKAFKELQMIDVEDSNADLTDFEKLNPLVAYVLVRYEWSCGVYSLVNSKIVPPEFFDIRKEAIRKHEMR